MIYKDVSKCWILVSIPFQSRFTRFIRAVCPDIRGKNIVCSLFTDKNRWKGGVEA